jgi:peptide/nickel transport system substrate-binding protein
MDKQSMANAVGGTINGGIPATTVLPPNNTGYVKQDVYATTGEAGNVTTAKAELAKCATAEPSYFTSSGALKSGVVLSTYSQQAHDAAMAAIAQSDLAKIGINITIDTYPSNLYYAQYAGSPTFAKSHNIVFGIQGWGADFPTGYGFMAEILSSLGINPAGGSTNVSYWSDTTFNNYITQALATADPTARNAVYAKADQYAMSQAALVPLVDLTSLFYRSSSATNVTFSQAYGMYDYSILGAK